MTHYPTRLLLDTCAIIWTVEGQEMSKESLEAVQHANAAGVPVLVSPISAWERGMLVARGRIASPLEPKAWFARLLDRPEVELADLTPDIPTDASFLPGLPHNDPADRILIATARAHDLTLVTRDRNILTYAGAGHVRALAC